MSTSNTSYRPTSPSLRYGAPGGAPSVTGSVNSLGNNAMEASFALNRNSAAMSLAGGIPTPAAGVAPSSMQPVAQDAVLAPAMANIDYGDLGGTAVGGRQMPEGSFVAVFAPNSELQDGVEEPSSYSLVHLYPGGRQGASRRLSFAPFLLRLARSLGKDPGVPGALKCVEASLTVQRTGMALVVACAQLGSWVVALGLPERLCDLRQVGGLCAMVADMCFYINGPAPDWREDGAPGTNPHGQGPRIRQTVMDSIDRICGRVFGQLLFRQSLVPGCLASAAFEGAVPHLPTDPEVRLTLLASLAQAEVLLPPLEEALSGSVHTSAFRECCLIHGGRVVASNLTAELTDAAWTVCLAEGFFLREPSHPPLMHVQDLFVHTSAAQTKSGRGLPEEQVHSPPIPRGSSSVAASLVGARNLASDPSASTVHVVLLVAGVNTTLACMVLYPEDRASAGSMDLSWELDVLLATAQDARQCLVEGWLDRRVLALEATLQNQPPQILDLIQGRPNPWNADAGPDPLVPFAFYETNFEQVKAEVQRARAERGDRTNARTPPRGRSPANSPPVSPPRSPRSRSGSPAASKPVLRFPALAQVDAYLFHDPTSGAIYASGPPPSLDQGASTPRKKQQERRATLEEVQMLYRMLPDLRKRLLLTEARGSAQAGGATEHGTAPKSEGQSTKETGDNSTRESVSLTIDQLMERVRSSVANLDGPARRTKAAAQGSGGPSRSLPDALPRSALFRVVGKDRLRMEEQHFAAKEGKVLAKPATQAKVMKEELLFPDLEDEPSRFVSAHFDPSTGREAYVLHAWVDEMDCFNDVFQELVLLHC